MPRNTSLRTRVRPWFPLALSLALMVGVSTSTHAQTDDTTLDFEVTVGQARDEAQARTDAVAQAIDEGCAFASAEACYVGFVAPNLPAAAEEATALADLLESLDVPDAYADDVAAHVPALREIADIRTRIAAAAGANDEPAVVELTTQEADTLAALAAELSPDYARFAFLSTSSDDDYISSFGGSTAEELEYLAGLRDAGNAAVPQFSCFSQALSVTYGDTDSLMQALADCGAGTALPAIEDATRRLSPPQRFSDEHDWMLNERAEASRLDRLIGAAAGDDDVTGFLTNNVRLGLLYRPYAGMDGGFYSAAVGAPAFDLDPTAGLARTDYGRGLFVALFDYAVSNPLANALGADFPQVPRSEVLKAITELGPELSALEIELREAIVALEPPDEAAADHARIVAFLEGRRDHLGELLGAAEAGDEAALFSIGPAADAEFCATAAGLSDEIEPLTRVFFDENSPECR